MLSVKYPESHGLDGKVHNIEIKVIQRVRPISDKNEHTLVYGKENGRNVIVDITKDPETGEWLKVPHTKKEYVGLQLCIYRQDLTKELKPELDGKTISNTEERRLRGPARKRKIEVFVDEHKNLYIMNAAAASLSLLPRNWEMYDYPTHPTLGNLYPITEYNLEHLMRYFEVVFRDINLKLNEVRRKETKDQEKEVKKINNEHANAQIEINTKLQKKIEKLKKLPGLSPLDSLNLDQYQVFLYRANNDPTSQEGLLISKYVSLGLDDITDKYNGVKTPDTSRLNSKVLIASKLLQMKYGSSSSDARIVLMDMNDVLRSSYTWEDYEIVESILHTSIEACTGHNRSRERNMNLLLANTNTPDGLGCALRVEDLRMKKKLNNGEKRL